MRSFISELLSATNSREREEARDRYDNEASPAMLAPPMLAQPTAPHPAYVKARTLLQTSIEKLTERQAVLMREIAARQGELYETNKTLEALAGAATAIHHEHEPEIDEDELARALSEGDAGVYENPIIGMTEEELAEEALKPSPLIQPYGRGKPQGFA